MHSVKSSESSLSSLSRKSGGNSVSSESKESVERIVTSENSENNVNCVTNLGGVASSIGTNGNFSFFCCNTFFYKWNEVSVTVLKLDISFLPGFVALDLFGFVETPLFDFWISPSSSLVFLTLALVVFPLLLLTISKYQ